jgi:hypothetical protein
MKRLPLKHSYHDALIQQVRYQNGEDVILVVDLCGDMNPSAGVATLHFLGVRNFQEVRDQLEATRQTSLDRPAIDEIIGIRRSDDRGILLDLQTAGEVVIDSRGIMES